MAFYQVVTRITQVYDLQLPERVKSLLEIFDVLNVKVEALGLPLQCLGLGSYEYSLSFTMFAPLVLAAAYVWYNLAGPYINGILARDQRWFRLGRPQEKLMAALTLTLSLSLTRIPTLRLSLSLSLTLSLTPTPYRRSSWPPYR
eukprot:scaffold93958_cov57-Phaeocystis_antarctica.AAC.1